MTKGVILAAFGKPNYIYMAAQLAGSIKAENPNIPITLLHDDEVRYLPNDYLPLFDTFVAIKPEHLYRNGRIDPGFVKINIPIYLQYDLNLYLDVDALCLKDLEPIFDTKKDFATEVVGTGKKSEDINYLFWTTNESAWKHFKIPEDGIYRSVQSSSMFFRKSKFVDQLHKEMVAAYDFPMNELSYQWGGTMPDELIIAGVCAKLQYDPAFKAPIMFFGMTYTGETYAQITERFYLLAIYGPKGLVRGEYLDWYDRKMVHSLRKMKLNKISGSRMLLRDKHVTQTR